MPPSRCLYALPLRSVDSATAVRRATAPIASSVSASSPSYQRRHASSAPAKGTRTLRLKKKGRPEKTARPPEPGERKALRKRIVLSNTNALPLRDLKPLAADPEASRPQDTQVATRPPSEVRTIPPEQIDQLRAVEAFKPQQGWSFFQTPAVLVRKEARKLSSEMKDTETSKKAIRKVITGEKGSGKSVTLLQAMTTAFQRGWVVINFPEGRDLTSASTAFAPIPGTNPIQYSQPAYTAKLLGQILAANKPVLSKLTIAEKPRLPFPIKDNITLAALLELGMNDKERSVPIFNVFWKELTSDARPPVLMCLDNLSHVMIPSKYQVLNEAGKITHVHAHDLALVKHFIDHLSGEAKLPNGGMILAATSASDAPRSEALEVGVAVATTRQNLDTPNATEKQPVTYSTPYTEVQALSPTKSKDPADLSNFWSPYSPIDNRVLSLFTSPTSPHIIRLSGLENREALALMSYWTRSGMHRGKVEPFTVNEAKVLAGGGVVGELERTVVRFLQRERVGVLDEPGGKKIRGGGLRVDVR